MRKHGKKQRESGYQKEYQQKHPDKMRIYNQNRQHKNHKITKDEWLTCKNYFDNSCCYCGLTYEESKIKYKEDLHKEHADHFGANDLSNCIPACKSCNSQKWEHPLDKWYNENNHRFTQERYDKIMTWLNKDYKKFIKILA
jgi:5-methylcytosine-specific restriction endonuclease McrA